MSGYQVSEDFLLNHAYRNVWCTPEQDKQAIFQPARVTPLNGVWSYFQHQWRKIMLPVSGPDARFHVYQIGQVHPAILGLLAKPNTWITAKEAMEQEDVLLDVYTSKGIMIPRCLCWYIVTGDNNLLVAIRMPAEEPVKLVDVNLDNDEVFLRLYSNAYFNSLRANYVDTTIKIESIKTKSLNDITSFQTKAAQLPAYGGTFYFLNGRRVDRIDLVVAKPGDYLEFVFDGSIKREVVFKVRDLQEFESTMDELHKFLLHYPGTSDLIDYQDDVDMYLSTTYAGDHWQGAYVHKNDSRTMRMVTHRDYSVPVIRIDGTQAANSFLVDKELDLRLTIRHSGYARPLVWENNRIAELYKLPSDRIVEAMTGLDSNLPLWTAASLEACAYTEIMRQPQGGVTRQLVQNAYGYNAMSVLLGNTPTPVTDIGGQKVIEIPEALRGCCTVYEYDAQGRLVFYSPHITDDTYGCQSPDTAFAEVIYGIGGTVLDAFDSTASGVLNPTHNYRFYRAPSIAGIRNGPWQDMTGDGVYVLTGDTYTWVTSSNTVNRVLSNKRHLAYSFEMAPLAGVFEFDLIVLRNGTYQKLDMPLGELDIFFNGYSLIEGLDFMVKDSRVVVCTKKYWDTSLEKQFFTVRFTGFCQKDMTRTPPPESGFVYHGNLSVNNHFDVRDDKVLRIVCGGRVRLRKDLDFAEDGISVNLTDTENGAPYAIRDIVVPMNNYLIGNVAGEDKTYEYRADALEIDQQVGDYLTRWLPEQKPPQPNVIPGRHILYSPFLSRIIADLKSGVLVDSKFEEHFGDDWLRTRLATYQPLLDFDPIGGSMTIDNRYVVVHPHPYSDYVSLDMFQWRVVERAAKLYAPGVDLSSAINVLQF